MLKNNDFSVFSENTPNALESRANPGTHKVLIKLFTVQARCGSLGLLVTQAVSGQKCFKITKEIVIFETLLEWKPLESRANPGTHQVSIKTFYEHFVGPWVCP